MKRYASDRKTGQPKPVERVELHEGHVKLRTMLLIVALVVAVGAFVYAAFSLLNVETGWREITVTSNEAHCGQDFEFTYHLGSGGTSALAEHRAVNALYSQAAVDAYRIFNSREAFPGVGNLFTLNQNVNKPVQLHPALYKALELVDALDSRYIYLAPLYEDYNSLFFCREDWETEGFDPYQNADVAAYMADVAAFARDPQAVDIALLGDNTVQLNVSDAYLAFCQEQGITAYVDLYWMQDAFIIDYLAETLETGGFTRGALSSYDGYVRCLSQGDFSYSYNFYDTAGQGTIARVARLNYPSGTSLAHLRAFPLDAQKEVYYYRFADGSVRVPYATMEDGKSRAGLPALVATSDSMGCAETLLRVLPHYAADSADPAALAACGVHVTYCQEGRITATDPAMTLDQIADGYSVNEQ